MWVCEVGNRSQALKNDGHNGETIPSKIRDAAIDCSLHMVLVLVLVLVLLLLLLLVLLLLLLLRTPLA